jgi:hypothetical protein
MLRWLFGQAGLAVLLCSVLYSPDLNLEEEGGEEQAKPLIRTQPTCFHRAASENQADYNMYHGHNIVSL